jgi:hypothetical protein
MGMNEPIFESSEDREARERKEKCFDKLTWRSREEAVAAAAYARWQYGGERVLTPYRCKFCNMWHLARG